MDAKRPRPYAIAPMGRLDGRAILVTGASSGIGRAIARRCASEGANVLATGRDEARLAELAQESRAIAVHPADLTEAGAADATELHDALTSLPLWPYMHIEVVPLAKHPNDPAS